MAAEQGFLDTIYEQDSEGQARVYADWASSYDAELRANGYVTPGRVAEALASCGAELSAPVVDFGCGTGLAGLALRKAGFGDVDGWDMSQEMLDEAAAKGCYRALLRIDPEQNLPAAPAGCRSICAAGVITPHHAPPETVATLLRLLPQGGLLGFSLNSHALEEDAFARCPERAVESGLAEMVLREHGPHIPARDMTADVLVLRRV